MTDDNGGGFLGRWARRKALARTGAPLPEPAALPDDVAVPTATAAAGTRGVGAPPAEPAPLTRDVPGSTVDAGQATPAGNSPGIADATAADGAAPTLSDVGQLTPASDFSRFVARDVAPSVRNAAVKKLFTDPHFNVMDGLDIYIDDYSRPDPLPAAVARQMVGADFLGLFDEPVAPAPVGGPAGSDSADSLGAVADAQARASTPTQEAVALSGAPTASAMPDGVGGPPEAAAEPPETKTPPTP